MSWFDRGFANLAKTALKEAQKQIDKALDIREEEENQLKAGNDEKKSKTLPNTPVSAEKVEIRPLGEANKRLTTSTWGSFSGSYFENEMITAPPRSELNVSVSNITTTTTTTTSSNTITPTQTQAQEIEARSSTSPAFKEGKRHSVTSNSDSVDLLSPSDIATSSDVNATSESVELASPSDITTPEESFSAAPCGTDSIVIISSNEGLDEEDDSLSYNTVMDETLTTAPSTVATLGNLATSFDDSKELSSCGSLTPRANVSQGNKKFLLSRDDVVVDSDSTQSFEDVQMLVSNESTCDNPLDDKFDLNQMILTSTTSYSSPHNSNDEIETNTTTTSSDIEIISNPNGDSSSTHSATRICPSKMKKFINMSSSTSLATSMKKGHCREPSEISVLSEDSQTEIDKLTHRISELTDQLNARESQLLQSERQNAVIQERNSELQALVDSLRSNAGNIDTASDDYTQRLSALEKKFQASIRERDALRIQIQALKDDLKSKVPKEQLDRMTTERDSMITELRLEGEKLSKEILQQSNIIKKLRAKEKISDATLKRNTIQIDELTDETERLKKTLNAKEDVERSQIEAVHKISSEKRRLEEENARHLSKIEDLESKMQTMQASFDAMKDELHQRTRVHLDLTRKADEAQETTKILESLKAENQRLTLQIGEMREKQRHLEQSAAKREQQLREENKLLLSRVEAAESRAENCTQEISLTTVPLMRQMESLQNTLSQRTANWNKEENLLLKKLECTQSRLKSLENVEAACKEKLDILQTRCLDLEGKLSDALTQSEQSTIALHQAQMDFVAKERKLNMKISALNETLEESKSRVSTLETRNKSLEERLLHSTNQTPAITAVKTATAHSSTDDLLQHKLAGSTTIHEAGDDSQLQRQQSQQSQHSPANSLGVNSLEEAMYGSFDWQAEDSDCLSNVGGRNAFPLMGGLNFMGHNNTSTIEHLQALLKQRDGELHQLQWEMSRMQSERAVLNEEITNLTLELENLKEKLLHNESLETNFNDLQHRYDELLQMYGEKEERTQELELDLFESREAYKKQLEELLAQPTTSLRKST